MASEWFLIVPPAFLDGWQKLPVVRIISSSPAVSRSKMGGTLLLDCLIATMAGFRGASDRLHHLSPFLIIVFPRPWLQQGPRFVMGPICLSIRVFHRT
jgi:hypothetical protein